MSNVAHGSLVVIFQEKLKNCIKLLDDFSKGQLPPDVTDKELWEAQKIKQVNYLHIYMHELPVSDLLIITNRNICLYQLKSYQTMSHIEKLVFGKSSVRPILLKV